MKQNQNHTGRPATAKARLTFILALTLWLGGLPGLLAQSVPDRLNYQGILLKGDGTPVPAVPTDVEFRIWDLPEGGELLWGRTHRLTPDTSGAFNVVLMEGGAPITGAANSSLAPVFTGSGSDSRYLELTVAGSTAIRPRQRFVAAPYAFLAHDVTAARQGFTVTGALAVNGAANVTGVLTVDSAANVAGAVTAASFTGNGAGLTNINTNSLVQQVVEALCPPGTIVAFGGTNSPSGWLTCNGALVSRATYQRLFSVIGTNYGVGDGSTTFNLPNLKGRMAVGYDPSDSAFNSLNKLGGEKTHLLTESEMPLHTHLFRPPPGGNVGLLGAQTGALADSGALGGFLATDPALTTDRVQSTGGSQAHNNLPPYTTLNYIIKY